ncbi:MAG: carbohydrate-binding module family 20 domain-containing protein [Alkaliphilus sp.]
MFKREKGISALLVLVMIFSLFTGAIPSMQAQAASSNTIVVDGAKDAAWQNPIGTSTGGGWQGFDIGNFYLSNDSNYLYFWVDAVNVPNWGDDGTYNEQLASIMGAPSISVNNGSVYFGTLPGGYAGVWSYNPNNIGPKIGDVVSTMGRAGNTAYIYGENLDGTVTVKFDSATATIISNTTECIEVIVPSVTPGDVNITVQKSADVSNPFVYTVLSGDQVQTIFHVSANTNLGENIHIVGSIPELGNWDTNKCTEVMLNPNYPEWFLPVSVPANTTFEYKYIKKDVSGAVIWESGVNRVFTSTSDTQGTSDTPLQYWR